MTGPAGVAAAASEADFRAVYAIRRKVFVGEQQVPVELERDADDERAQHLLARLAGVPAATARVLLRPDQVAVVSRVAVLAPFRGRGLGCEVMAAAEACAARAGAEAVELHAQVPARGFYDLLGYGPVGEEYVEAGIRHVTMRKGVKSA